MSRTENSTGANKEMFDKKHTTLVKSKIGRLKGTALHRIYTNFRIWWETGQLIIQEPMLKMASKSGVLSSFYYFAFSRRFDLEHRSVIAGRLVFLKNRRRPDGRSNALLRRNIHRLEKGISMRPRRTIFALDFIVPTVDIYCSIAQISGHQPNRELLWARDVLQVYFDLCGQHPQIVSVYERFLSIKLSDKEQADDVFPYITGSRAPYAHESVPASTVTYQNLLALAQRRRSVRWFAPQMPERELVDKAISLGSLAPTACNRLPYRYEVLDDPALVIQAARLAGGTGGFAEQIPMLIVLIGNLGAYFHERDRHLIYIDGSLSAMSTVFALETLGLSSCCINWSDVPDREEGMKNLLSLGDHERPIMLIAVGYADPIGVVPYSSKKELPILRSYNLAAH